MRIHHYEGVTLALLANAYEGFSVCLPEASLVLLHAFEQAFRISHGSMQTRLHYAFEVTRERFDALDLDPTDAFGDPRIVPPTGSLLAVAITGKTACAIWMGNKVVFHVRGFEVTRTTPHTLREQYRAKDPSTHAFIDNLPINMLSGGIHRDARSQTPSTATFNLLPGDSLVLTHHEHHIAEEVAYAAASFLSPQRAADCLAGLAMSEENWFATAMVLRFDDFDFAREIDRLIDAYEAPAHMQQLEAWGRKHRALPVCLEDPYNLGEFFPERETSKLYAITSEGTVLGDSEPPFEAGDDPFSVSERVVDADLLYAISASKKFPTLASLAPRKSPNAQPCTDPGPAFCFRCMGLGWLLPTPPERMVSVGGGTAHKQASSAVVAVAVDVTVT